MNINTLLESINAYVGLETKEDTRLLRAITELAICVSILNERLIKLEG